MEQPHVTGPWVSDDHSAHHLEMAPTDAQVKADTGSEPVIALRDTGSEPDNVIYSTRGHLRKLAQAAQQPDSATARLLGTARR
jgi:hypothetical protein